MKAMEAVLEKINHQFQQQLPFVLYNKPNASQVIGIYQLNNHLHLVEDFEETGFVFASFDENQIILLPKEHSEVIVSDFVLNNSEEKSIIKIHDDSGANHFRTLIQKGIDAIKEGNFTKVVLSRKEIVDLDEFDLTTIIQNLFQSYPSAFTYCFYHPKVGLWLGAFSEQLIKKQGNVISTMAVAGTQTFTAGQEISWGIKEQEEQRHVSDYIVNELQTFTSNINVAVPYTLIAGNIIHIKTDIQASLKQDSNLKELISALHPTPAVCGLPKKAALDFIVKNEGYEREFYSGFLGELNKDFGTRENNTELYVNLRCMKIEKAVDGLSKAHLYIGCGITKDSVPEKEWHETVNKSMTIRKVLN